MARRRRHSFESRPRRLPWFAGLSLLLAALVLGATLVMWHRSWHTADVIFVRDSHYLSRQLFGASTQGRFVIYLMDRRELPTSLATNSWKTSDASRKHFEWAVDSQRYTTATKVRGITVAGAGLYSFPHDAIGMPGQFGVHALLLGYWQLLVLEMLVFVLPVFVRVLTRWR